MTFQEKQLSFISILSGVLLIFYGIIENKSSSMDNNIILLNSQRNIETLDYIMLNRDKDSSGTQSQVLTLKQLQIEEYDTKISKLMKRQSRLDNFTSFLIISVVLFNFSVYFPLSQGETLKTKRTFYVIYRVMFFLSLGSSIVFLILAFTV